MSLLLRINVYRKEYIESMLILQLLIGLTLMISTMSLYLTLVTGNLVINYFVFVLWTIQQVTVFVYYMSYVGGDSTNFLKRRL